MDARTDRLSWITVLDALVHCGLVDEANSVWRDVTEALRSDAKVADSFCL